ncbi:hypothetical protein MSG28_015391 [Choristoneura fumiferana]|uniref:Uncharacterized protein n=1 Tax=Choristoneura fumiferana TaxID=7141 RepID=A0ACC0KA21_CHOFU|nr:hypothetical protein MSG28_015391 [Choristoneura fumiferana]
MSTTALQESAVKESLFQFITKNVPSADLDVIDDIVLSYVISFVEESSQDPCFDVEGFIEMMAAYVPQFAHIDVERVCSWVVDLEALLTAEESDPPSSHGSSPQDGTLQRLMASTLNLVSLKLREFRGRGGPASVGRDDFSMLSAQCAVLHEMFPNTCAMEIKHCVSIACGDVERAAATLLHRRDHGQALAATATAAPHHAARAPPCDDSELKNRIIARRWPPPPPPRRTTPRAPRPATTASSRTARYDTCCISELRHLLPGGTHGQALAATATAAPHHAARAPPCDDSELKNRIIARYDTCCTGGTTGRRWPPPPPPRRTTPRAPRPATTASSRTAS